MLIIKKWKSMINNRIPSPGNRNRRCYSTLRDNHNTMYFHFKSYNIILLSLYFVVLSLPILFVYLRLQFYIFFFILQYINIVWKTRMVSREKNMTYTIYCVVLNYQYIYGYRRYNAIYHLMANFWPRSPMT